MAFFDNDEENDLLGEITDLLQETDIATKKSEPKKDEGIVEIPIQYRVISTHNNEETGKEEPFDSFKCDRIRGIVPIDKARLKADNLKKVYPKKRFFVIEELTFVYPNGKTVKGKRITYKTL